MCVLQMIGRSKFCKKLVVVMKSTFSVPCSSCIGLDQLIRKSLLEELNIDEDCYTEIV